MKEVVRTLVLGRAITIDTVENDPVDIRCGGPRYLGFDFVVDAEENVKDLEKFLKGCFNKFGMSFQRIYISNDTIEVPKAQIWNHDLIESCIKKNDV
jgi:hypothetical protein